MIMSVMYTARKTQRVTLRSALYHTLSWEIPGQNYGGQICGMEDTDERQDADAQGRR